ncbi:MAG TPA: DinB family protein [Anaerolineales bacterium]|nr:DinB family protein [Anaerolineales bacterium]
MSAKSVNDVIQDYEFTAMLVHNLVDGLTQEETLIQLPYDVNCLNWVLGHIIANRSHALEVVSAEHAWQEDIRRLYHTGTENIKPDSESIQVDILLKHLDESVELLKSALENVDDGYLSEHFTNYRGEKTREAHLSGFHWHETYHIGQLEIFRALAISQRNK